MYSFPSDEICHCLAIPGNGSFPSGCLITRPSIKAIKILLSGTPVTVWGSRSFGSVPFPKYRILLSIDSSTGGVFSPHELIMEARKITKNSLSLILFGVLLKEVN